jgi:hypothetical protein
MKTLAHEIARLTGLSLLVAIALTAIVISTSHAGSATASPVPAGAPATVDTLDPGHAWPIVALAIARPALRAVRLAIVETIRLTDVIVFRSYGVRRLAHFTGVDTRDGFPWASRIADAARTADDSVRGARVAAARA